MSDTEAGLPSARLDTNYLTIETLNRSRLYCSASMLPPEPLHFEKDLTLFVPCYNEAESILATFGEIVTAMAALEWSWEIVLFDDASTDGTADLVRDFMEAHPEIPLLLVVREVNQGLAQNFIDAAFLGRGRYFRIVNGDNTDSSEMLVTIFSHLGEADMLIPFHTENPGRSVFRRLLSRAFTILVNTISGHDIRYYNGCCVHERYNVMRWHVNCYGFDFQANLITRLLDLGKTYLEVPVIGGERSFGYSKALTLKNFLSSAHFFLDLVFRKIGWVAHVRKQ